MNYETEIINIANEYNGKLPQSDIGSIISLAKHREWGGALDNLCTQIDEYELAISKKSFLKIEQMTKEMNLSEVDLDSLRRLIE